MPDAVNPLLTERFDRALVYASDLHRRQLRKGTRVPYVAHLLGVAAIVLEEGGDEDQAIAALLHDAVEDQGGTPTRAEIARQFGERVAEIVDGCTDSDQTPKPPWRARKEAYIAHIRDEADPATIRVSLADKVHNTRAIRSDVELVGDAAWSRFSGGKTDTLWYYRTLVTAFRQKAAGHLVDELDRIVTDLERLA